MKVKINKTKEMSRLFDEIENEEVGYVTTIEVFESQEKDNGAWLNIVKLDEQTLAFRSECDSQDGEWAAGSIEDAVDAAIEMMCWEL